MPPLSEPLGHEMTVPDRDPASNCSTTRPVNNPLSSFQAPTGDFEQLSSKSLTFRTSSTCPRHLVSNERNLVRVVVGCAHRKRRPPAQGLRLGIYPTDIEVRSTQWIKRIGSPESDTVTAHDLYMGEHWSVVRSLPETARDAGCTAEIWVVSAGYGLVPAQSSLESYSATFSPGSRDSVALGVSGKERNETNRYWWEQLTKPRKTQASEATSLAGLARKDPSVPMIVALSEAYVQAVREDLVAASVAMGDQRNLLLVATGDPLANLEHAHLPCDARFVNSLGGTRTALNARVVDLMIRNYHHHSFDLTKVRRILQDSLDRAGSIPSYGHRERKSDVTIRGLIRGQLCKRDYSKSALLRILRDEGVSCEQKRFNNLFEEVRNEGCQ